MLLQSMIYVLVVSGHFMVYSYLRECTDGATGVEDVKKLS